MSRLSEMLSSGGLEGFSRGFLETHMALSEQKKAEKKEEKEYKRGLEKILFEKEAEQLYAQPGKYEPTTEEALIRGEKRKQEADIFKSIYGKMAERGELAIDPEGKMMRPERPALPTGFEVTEIDPMTGLPRKAERRETLEDFLQEGQVGAPVGEPAPSAGVMGHEGMDVPGIEKAPSVDEILATAPVKDKYRLKKFTYKGKQYEVDPSEADVQREREEKVAGEKVKLLGKQAEQAQKYKSNFYQTVGLFSRTIAQIKGKEEEQGGLGLMSGLKGVAAAKAKVPGYGRTSAAFGQRTETALRMNSMLTGQNRVIKSVVNMIFESLPGDFDPPDQVASKISQSLKNAYILSKSFEKAGLSPRVFNKMTPKELDGINANALISSYNLTPEEEREIEMIIKDVLATPMAKSRMLPKADKRPAQPKRPGGKLMEDAQGNKAWVFPDGSFEEVR